ncbi:hypothetical protein Bbelb_231490 [Branchiostoma belcheri]|nr:hypothetical protein Bbelb_231490 [Branchiostoma belcheri]
MLRVYVNVPINKDVASSLLCSPPGGPAHEANGNGEFVTLCELRMRVCLKMGNLPVFANVPNKDVASSLLCRPPEFLTCSFAGHPILQLAAQLREGLFRGGYHGAGWFCRWSVSGLAPGVSAGRTHSERALAASVSPSPYCLPGRCGEPPTVIDFCQQPIRTPAIINLIGLAAALFTCNIEYTDDVSTVVPRRYGACR